MLASRSGLRYDVNFFELFMNVCLKTSARRRDMQTAAISIGERKPERLSLPAELTCQYQIDACSNYHILKLKVQGILQVTCQRCLGVFEHAYANETQLALCANDEIAETLMADFESIVVHDQQLNLTDVITDELYLWLPEKHLNDADCDTEIKHFFQDNG
jgi:uncharacterized protein